MKNFGAPGETRTPTPLRATDFESAASTNSTTGALLKKEGCTLRGTKERHVHAYNSQVRHIMNTRSMVGDEGFEPPTLSV